MKNYILLFFLISGNLFGSSCYTAVNGFAAVAKLEKKLLNEFSSTAEKINGLSTTTNEYSTKMAKVLLLQKQIRKMESQNYIKSKQILHNLKARNEELGINASLKIEE